MVTEKQLLDKSLHSIVYYYRNAEKRGLAPSGSQWRDVMFLREHSRIIMRTLRLVDIAFVCAAFVLALGTTQGWSSWTLSGILQVLISHAGFLLIIGVSFRVAASWEQFYRSRRLERLTADSSCPSCGSWR